MFRYARFVLALAVFAPAGCGGTWRGSEPPEVEGTGVGNLAGVTVVTAGELHASGQSVLSAIMGKVPNMKVTYTAGLDRCPSIAMRSFEDHRGSDRPSVYVDGTRANDTCVLETLDARDVQRVEIYPMGFTKRPGYATNNAGLILVFLRRS